MKSKNLASVLKNTEKFDTVNGTALAKKKKNVGGTNGILYAQPVADVLSVVITIFMALRFHKELAETESHITARCQDNVPKAMVGYNDKGQEILLENFPLPCS